ncbi:MAG: hypothetical protein ABSG34_05405 [Candidatus Sulfotelmatobacter sp.]
MGTNATQSQHASGSGAAHPALAKEAVARRAEAQVPATPRKPSGYGLPCSKCHLYYPADLDVCPTCKHNERVSPVVPKIPVKSAQTAGETVPDTAVLEQEREEFLRQFKAQLREAHAEVADTPDAICKFGEHHPGETAPAEICTGCYERIQERADICEAALHMELKEAAQIVYDAVWADSSDPSKTYQNAASALLSELRKRAGITAVRGPFQPLTH